MSSQTVNSKTNKECHLSQRWGALGGGGVVKMCTHAAQYGEMNFTSTFWLEMTFINKIVMVYIGIVLHVSGH